MNCFFQTPPTLGPELPAFLMAWLRAHLPTDVFPVVATEARRLSDRVIKDLEPLHQELQDHPPLHRPYDPWGRRIDELVLHPAWDKLKAVAAEEGLVALGYERPWGEHSRLHQYAKLFLYHPSSAFFSCPVAMTDGAAKIIEQLAPREMKSVFERLTTRNPKDFWTSGQWMTEREGGSDVGGSSTIARRQADGSYHLSGTKWFSSATTAEVAFALARIEGAPAGSRGLSLFFIPVKNTDGQFNGIVVNRLKDKLGTRALPTAELTLSDCQASLVGEAGNGVKNIAQMLNITRLHNAICACAQMNRAWNLIKDYANRRVAFGSLIGQHPLHQIMLGRLRRELFLGLGLTLTAVELFGREELGRLSQDEKFLMRLLIPIAKLVTAKKSVLVASECLEAFGGAGYVEDTRLPLQLRDAQVFPIWEGTTHILSLDILRVTEKAPHVWQTLMTYFDERLKAAAPTLRPETETLQTHWRGLAKYLERLRGESPEVWEYNARDLAFAVGHLTALTAWLTVASHTADPEVTQLLRLSLEDHPAPTPTLITKKNIGLYRL